MDSSEVPMSLAASRFIALAAVLLSLHSPLFAADWPTYRQNNARLGSTKDELTRPLRLRWLYSAATKPRLGFSGPDGRTIEGLKLRHRIQFDDAFHVAIASGRVFFGSSVDHQLHCRDLDTGKTLWTFMTGAPIRLAPTVWEGLVLFGSDDGYAYCLDADSGKLKW